ncbi:unnamed protein product, partial [Amoebophrya sp. A25]
QRAFSNNALRSDRVSGLGATGNGIAEGSSVSITGRNVVLPTNTTTSRDASSFDSFGRVTGSGSRGSSGACWARRHGRFPSSTDASSEARTESPRSVSQPLQLSNSENYDGILGMSPCVASVPPLSFRHAAQRSFLPSNTTSRAGEQAGSNTQQLF